MSWPAKWQATAQPALGENLASAPGSTSCAAIRYQERLQCQAVTTLPTGHNYASNMFFTLTMDTLQPFPSKNCGISKWPMCTSDKHRSHESGTPPLQAFQARQTFKANFETVYII